jgi:regulator of sirC expression with transglutaminase-like and TPR domain
MKLAPPLWLLLFALFVNSIPLCASDAANSKPAPPPESWFARKACSVQDQPSAADTLIEGCPGLDTFVAGARQAVAGSADPSETIDRLNAYFYQTETFQVTYDLSSADHLLPGPVLAGKKGYCVGLATIYLILAEELNLPIHAVATPQHVFLRWDDGRFRRNIELFREGREVPDGDYIREQKIPQTSIDRGVFLANLTEKEFFGFIHQNLGVLESQRGNFENSGQEYARAIHFNPKLAAALYNRGNDELKQGRYRKAVRDYTKSLKLYPTDAWALWNRGLAWRGMGQIGKAEMDQAHARQIEPGFKPPE